GGVAAVNSARGGLDGPEYRVRCAGIERIGGAAAAQRRPGAAPGTESQRRGRRILRAGRDEPAARPQQWTEEALVAAQQEEEQACDHRVWTRPRTHLLGCRCCPGRV